MYNILICDDEKDIVSALKIYLNSEEYNLFVAYNGAQAIETVKNNDIHLVLLDIMMPLIDGIEAMNSIREFSNVPIILLTAKSEETDKIYGLNSGADDYITKPFQPFEVLARVKSQLRRYLHLGGSRTHENSLVIGNIELNDLSKTVFVDGEAVFLTPTEYDILKLLMQNPNKVFSPNDIYKRVWKDVPISSENTVAVHIRHIREKIEITPAEPRYLKVVWGQGYKMEG